MFREQYPYLYETHLHTSMVSACALDTPQDMVRAAKAAGYTGIFVTEHNWRGNSCIDRSLLWEDWIDALAGSYYAALEEGRKIGLQVFFAYEAGFFGTSSHGAEFLICGVTPQWLKAHPQLRDMDAPEHLALVRSAGAMAVHAHPFRYAPYIPGVKLFTDLVDAVEGINAAHAHSQPQSDQQAIEYARQSGLPLTAGSDIHMRKLSGGGVAFRRPITDVADYCRAILSDEDRLLTNGTLVFDKQGNLLTGPADWR